MRPNFKGARMKDTIFGVRNCKVIAEGIAPSIIHQSPPKSIIGFAEDAQNWVVILANRHEVLCEGRGQFTPNATGGVIILDKMTAQVIFE